MIPFEKHKENFEELYDVQFLEVDAALLARVDPKNRILGRVMRFGAPYDAILWQLCGFADKETILDNRKPVKTLPFDNDETESLQEQVEELEERNENLEEENLALKKKPKSAPKAKRSSTQKSTGRT